MITIIVDASRCKVSVNGHAGYDEPGKDIVCAAVSILVYTLAERLNETGNLIDAELSPGYAKIEAIGNAESATTIETIAAGFALLAGEYPGFVNVQNEGLT